MSLRPHGFRTLALPALAAALAMSAPAAAETTVVDPCTVEVGMGFYSGVVYTGDAPKRRSFPIALSQTLTYAFSQTYAYTTSFAVAGRDLVVGSVGARIYPRDDARRLAARDGVLETRRSSLVKPFLAGKLEFGRARSDLTFDQTSTQEIAATFQGAGVGGGVRIDITSRFGLGLDATVSEWVDAPSSSVTMNSLTSAVNLEAHFNF